MLYFFILPLFVLLEVSLFVASLIALKFQKVRWTSGYLMGIVWGSTVGFVAANLLLWVASYLPSLIAEKYALSETIQSITKYILAFGLLIGPLFASAGGLFIGALFGGGIVYFRRKAAK